MTGTRQQVGEHVRIHERQVVAHEHHGPIAHLVEHRRVLELWNPVEPVGEHERREALGERVGRFVAPLPSRFGQLAEEPVHLFRRSRAEQRDELRLEPRRAFGVAAAEHVGDGARQLRRVGEGRVGCRADHGGNVLRIPKERFRCLAGAAGRAAPLTTGRRAGWA